MRLDRRAMLGQAALLPITAAVLSHSASAKPAAPIRLWDGFSAPVGMSFDRVGNLYVAEWSAGRVLQISPNGRRSTFAEGLSGPAGIAVDANDVIYVGSYSRDEVYRFIPNGKREVYVTGLATPAGLYFDRSGRLLIANQRTNEILAATGENHFEPIIGDLNTPVGAVQTTDGGYVVSNIAGGVTVVRPDGSRIESGQDFRAPGPGIVLAPDGRVFATDYGGATIREVLMHGASRTVADGLPNPVGLVLAPDGKSLLTATWGDGAIYRIALV